MVLSCNFTSHFSKKGIFFRDFENFVNQQSQSVKNDSFIVTYDISDIFAKMFTRQELTNFMNKIFTELQFVKICVQNSPCLPETNNNIESNLETTLNEKLKEFEYCFYKVETTKNFKKTDVICNDTENWIGVKAKFVKYSS